MTLYLDGRTGKERRDRELAFPQTGDCRRHVERRITRTPGDRTLEEYNRVLSEGYWGASEDDSTTE